MSKNSKRTVFTILMIIIINLATKLLGFVRDAYLWQVFDPIPELPTYFVSLNLTTLSFLSLGSALVVTTIPLIINLRGNENKDKVLSGILTYLLVFSLIGITIFYIFSGVIIRVFYSDLPSDLAVYTTSNIRILSVTLLFIVITYFNIALLQSNEEYRIPAMISIPYNILIIIFLFFIGNTKGVTSLVLVTMFGWFLQMLLTIPKTLKFAEFKFRPTFKNTDGLVISTLVGIIPIMLVYLTTQANIAIANSFLVSSPDDVSIYYYGQLMFSAIGQIIVYAIGAVMFPKFSITFNDNKKEFFNLVSQVGQSIIVLMLPITIGLLLFSQPIVEIIFLQGDFPVDLAQKTANMLKILSLYLIAYGFLDILNRGYYTLNDKKTPIIGTGAILTSSLIFNYIFINILDLNLYFVGLSTVISYFIGVAVSSILFSKKYGNLGVRNILKSFVKSMIAALCMIITQVILHKLFGKTLSDINVLFKILVLCIEGLSVVLVYVGVLMLLKEKNLYEFIIRLKNKNK